MTDASANAIGSDPGLRPLGVHDAKAAHALYRAVRWPHRLADVAALIELGAGVVAETGGRVDGIGLWWGFGDDAARIGSVIVDPRAQGRGLGRRIMNTLLEATGSRAVMLAATEAGAPLYRRLGFRETGTIRQHQGPYERLPSGDPRIRAATEADRAWIARLDAAAFGAGRGAALDHLLAVGRTMVIGDRGRPAGYAIDRAFGRGRVVGPIVAETEEDAIALFRAVATPGFVRVDCPGDALRLAAHLADCGLPLVDTEVTMERGAWPAPAGPARLWGLASHALG